MILDTTVVAVALFTFFRPGQSQTTSTSRPFLNFSSSAPYIFSSLHGLLQQWSNTFFPNGHTITACEIPAHTLLYHGRYDVDPPSSPEWLAFDIEMAYAIMGSMRDSRMLTYRTTRKVNCVYFDGLSADLMGTGPTESQMVFIYGDSESVPLRPGKPDNGSHGDGCKPPNFSRWNSLEDEYFRATELCKWIKERGLGGRGWGYEGVVRASAGFELIWCDFDSPSLEIVSRLNVSVPLWNFSPDNESQPKLDFRKDDMQRVLNGYVGARSLSVKEEDEHDPSLTDPREPYPRFLDWMWFRTAVKRYGSTGNQLYGPGQGEVRVTISSCGLYSFYDSRLYDQTTERMEKERVSLNISGSGLWDGPEDIRERKVASQQLTRRRRTHRTNKVSKNDGQIMRGAVEDQLRANLNGSCSGADWHLVAREVVAFYSANLQEIGGYLHTPIQSSKENTKIWLAAIRERMHWLMMPFFEYPQESSSKEYLKKAYSINSSRAQEAIQRCRTQYTIRDPDTLNDGEKLVMWAIEETLHGICTSLFAVGLEVEYEWLASFNGALHESKSLPYSSSDISTPSWANRWRQLVEELMAWLGWAEQWTGCEPQCGVNEACYIPMWPIAGCPKGDTRWDETDQYLWHPFCVNSSSYPTLYKSWLKGQ